MEGDARPPKELSDDSGNLAEKWKIWKKEFQTYMKITKGFKKPEDEQVAWLRNFIGPVGLHALEKISFDKPKDEENLTIVLEKLGQFFNFSKNERVKRYEFFSKSKRDNESIDAFINDLVEMSKSCNFGEQRGKMINDVVILNTKDTQLRNLLFEEPDLTLNKIKSIYKSFELMKGAKESMTDCERSALKQAEQFKNPCSKCGYRHPYKKCLAFDKVCHYCKQLNHFAQFCPIARENRIRNDYVSNRVPSEQNKNNFNGTINIDKPKNPFEQIDKLQNVVESKIQQKLGNKISVNDFKKSKSSLQNELKTQATTKNLEIKSFQSVSSAADARTQKQYKQRETVSSSSDTINTVANPENLKNVVETRNPKKFENKFPANPDVTQSTSLDLPENDLTISTPTENPETEPSAREQNNHIPPSYNSLYPNSAQTSVAPPRQCGPNYRETTNAVGSRSSLDKSDPPGSKPLGSNPLGSNPPGSNPPGSNPTGSSINEFVTNYLKWW